VEFFLAVLLCLFFIMLAFVGWIHMGMEQQKARAIVYARKMEPDIDAWVFQAAESAKRHSSDTAAVNMFLLTADNYFNCKKSRDILKKVSIVNQLAAQAVSMADSGMLRVSAELENNEFSGSIERLIELRPLYNRCVRNLSKRLEKRIPATIGKLFRVRRLEELNEAFESIM